MQSKSKNIYLLKKNSMAIASMLGFYPITVEQDSGKVVDPNWVLTTIQKKLKPWNYTITILKGHKRTLKQNAMYRAIVNDLAENSWEDADTIHHWLKNMFLSKKMESELFGDCSIVWSTAELTTKQFNMYLDKVANRAAQFGTVIQ